MEFVVGIDGGGTKTAIQARLLNGKIKASATIGPLNYNGKKKSELELTVKQFRLFLDSITGESKDCRGICIATAGISNSEAVSWLQTMFSACDINGNIMIVGDEKAAHYGAFQGGAGIVLVSGTGSVCYGENSKKESHRSGGYGYLIDDEGSGYAIGRDILSAAVRCYDKREKDDLLLSLVLDQIHGRGIGDLIRYTYPQKFDKAKIAALAPLLLTAYEVNDPLAHKIVEKAARELVNLVFSVASSLSMNQGSIAYLGGILRGYRMVSDLVTKKLSYILPGFTVCEPLEDSVSGATRLALQQYERKEGN